MIIESEQDVFDTLQLAECYRQIAAHTAMLGNYPIDILRQELLDAVERYDLIHNADRKGDWMPLGRSRIWLEDPRPQDFNIDDIAHALARINRFNGHTKHSYSVAQHAVYVSELCEIPFGLHHDDPEVYLGDVVSPLKRLVRPIYEPIEDAFMQAIAIRFNFTMTKAECAAVKKADLIMLATEMRDLTPSGVLNPKISKLELPRAKRITGCWSAEEAEERFLERFKELGGQRA